MYNLRYSNPKLSGYIYRRKGKCGKPNCKCARTKHRHTAYQLQYRELVGGKWKQRSEYIPKCRVRALRARIKRAKERDREFLAIFKDFLAKNPRLITDSDIEGIRAVIPHLSALQAAQVYHVL